MSPTADPPTPGYTVTGQTEQFKQQPNGQFADGVTIMFTTSGGVAGTVWVPAAQYQNIDAVRTAIEARVAAINAVQALGS